MFLYNPFIRSALFAEASEANAFVWDNESRVRALLPSTINRRTRIHWRPSISFFLRVKPQAQPGHQNINKYECQDILVRAFVKLIYQHARSRTDWKHLKEGKCLERLRYRWYLLKPTKPFAWGYFSLEEKFEKSRVAVHLILNFRWKDSSHIFRPSERRMSLSGKTCTEEEESFLSRKTMTKDAKTTSYYWARLYRWRHCKSSWQSGGQTRRGNLLVSLYHICSSC